VINPGGDRLSKTCCASARSRALMLPWTVFSLWIREESELGKGLIETMKKVCCGLSSRSRVAEEQSKEQG
jgi:hypothetical protein